MLSSTTSKSSSPNTDIPSTRASFHLLIPASEKNPNLCKTLLSASVLRYPSPTLINFHKNFTGDGWDKGSHLGKIRGIFDYLSNSKQIKLGDLVLVVDGYDVWFQLPPEVLLRRYRDIIERDSKRLKKEFGVVQDQKPWQPGENRRTPRFTQRVIYGADKECWPNRREDPACSSVPASTLPDKAWGPATDKDPGGWLNRPRYLNSGCLVGSVADVKKIYEQAVVKVEEQSRGNMGDQFVISEIFGEQEFQRNMVREAIRSSGTRWKQWLFEKAGLSKNHTENDVTPKGHRMLPGQRYEYGLGLDYEMDMFQTMTHSHADMDFFHLNSTEGLNAAIKAKNLRTERPLAFLKETSDAPPPFPRRPRNQSNVNQMSTLDALPDHLSWADVAIATNIHVPSVPVLLHFNGEKSYLDTWWPRMWYQPYARALLRRYFRDPQTHSTTWDQRGGLGGFWTDQGQWLSWKELCGGFEEEIFGDGRGEWGKEEGGRKIYNEWGELVENDENGV